jgi:hypothetical protein
MYDNERRTMCEEIRPEYEDLFFCYYCGAVHFNSDRCPECSAGAYYQCSSDKDGRDIRNAKYYVKALQQKAQRLRREADRVDAVAKKVELYEECVNSD